MDLVEHDVETNNEQLTEAAPAPRPLSRGSISPSRKTISRSGSGRSNSLRPLTSASYHAHDVRNDDVTDVTDDVSDTGYDTDLEIEDDKDEYDTTGKASYVIACKKYDVTPVSYFMRHMQDSELVMKHHGLGCQGTRAISVPLVTNTKLLKLDLSDNWLDSDGGIAIGNMLKENCYITHLNLSDNHLGLQGIQLLCHVVQEYNDTVQHLNLSGNELDDDSGETIANLIVGTQKLEYLNISHNKFGKVGAKHLGFAISENTSLKELDLSWNHFRRKEATQLVRGIGANIFLKKLDLSWNGLALEGATALREALIANNVLEELIISNNNITVEGAVEIAKALAMNNTLRVLDIGENPVQSAGGYGLLLKLKENSQSAVELLFLTNIVVNKDFQDIEAEVKEVHPNLVIKYTDVESEKFPKPKVKFSKIAYMFFR